MGIGEEMEALAKLKNDGSITEEEYAAAKARLLSQSPEKSGMNPFITCAVILLVIGVALIAWVALIILSDGYGWGLF